MPFVDHFEELGAAVVKARRCQEFFENLFIFINDSRDVPLRRANQRAPSHAGTGAIFEGSFGSGIEEKLLEESHDARVVGEAVFAFLDHTVEGAGREVLADRWRAGGDHRTHDFLDFGLVAEFSLPIGFLDDRIRGWRGISEGV